MLKMRLLVAERFADGLATERDLFGIFNGMIPWDDANNAASRTCNPDAQSAARGAVTHSSSAILNHETTRYPKTRRIERRKASQTQLGHNAVLTALIRDIIGPLPFRLVPLDPCLLVWNDATIPKVAQAIYDDRAFDRLPILADALEDAGCDNADILTHCRQRWRTRPRLLGRRSPARQELVSFFGTCSGCQR